MSLQIDLLGRFSLHLDGVDVTEETRPRTQDLLAWLILHRAAASPRRVIASAFWPDVRDEQALKNLRTLATRLRESLPAIEPLLRIDNQSMGWKMQPWCQVDLVTFEEARVQGMTAFQAGNVQLAQEALALAAQIYAGDLLPAHEGEWLEKARARLRRQWLDGLEQLWLVLTDSGEHRRAQDVAQRLVQEEPLDERGWTSLMRSQLSLGDRAGALRTYFFCAQMIRRELGVDPGLETQRVYESALFEESDLQGSRDAIKLLYALWNVWKTPTPRS